MSSILNVRAVLKRYKLPPDFSAALERLFMDAATGGNKSQAALAPGISRQALYRLLSAPVRAWKRGRTWLAMRLSAAEVLVLPTRASFA